MRYEFKKIRIDTEKGIKQAERLQAAGWNMTQIGIDLLQFDRPIPPKKPKDYTLALMGLVLLIAVLASI